MRKPLNVNNIKKIDLKTYWDIIYHKMSSYVIYKICCDNIDYVYIGSTKNMIKRKSRHKINCNNENNKNHNCKLYKTIRDNGGWDNWRMVIIDELGDVSKTQARIKEEKWRVELQANLNMVKAYRTEEEKQERQKELRKQYYEENKDKVLEQQKEYRKYNKEYHKEYQKEYQQQNKDKLAEYNKEYQKKYYEQNRDEIIKKIICECGSEISNQHLARHKKTKKHQAWEWRQTIQS